MDENTPKTMKRGDYIICRTCKGRGKFYDPIEGIFTFGLSYLFGIKKKCPRCHGKGYIKIE